ncbi:hypothetical protein [Pantoea ananatis]|uniref:hypothetical protein n=1 Tax=Pantoea ananas TaxID=553 RepID=UPI00234FB8A1|nr:hypothetical protein [Pantoea ananatis]
MSAGTIALTYKSTTVSGTGTSFTTELKSGDFVYVNVGGAPYTLVAANVTSDMQLTLAVAFDGPTTSGLAWNAVPASLQVALTQKILNDFASVARGRILDFQNWQKIYSDESTVTVARPDGITFTGPGWGYLASQLADKVGLDVLADYLTQSDNLGSLTDKSAARTNLELGDSATKDVGSVAGTVAAGDDSRIVDAFKGSNVTGTPWIPLSLFNGWSVNGRAVYRKILGMTFIDLHITGGTYSDGTVIATMAAEYAPPSAIHAVPFAVGASGGIPPRLIINTDGTVRVYNTGGNADMHLTMNYCIQ